MSPHRSGRDFPPLLPFLAFLVAAPVSSQTLDTSAAVAESLVIGCISSEVIPDGCRSLLSTGTVSMDSLVFASTIGGIGPTTAWMNVNGVDTELRMVKSTRPKGKKYQGQKFREQFRAGNLIVTVDYVIAEPSSAFHGTVECSAVIVVKKGSTIQTLRAGGTRGC